MAVPVVRARPRRPGSGRSWRARAGLGLGPGPGPAAGLCRCRRAPGKPRCRLLSSAARSPPPVNVLGGVGPRGSLSVLGQPSPGRRCEPPPLAASRRSFRASGEAVFDLHFLLSHGARAAASPVTSRSRPAWRRRLQREFSCVSSPARHAWPPRGGFPAALPAPARAPAPRRPPAASSLTAPGKVTAARRLVLGCR